MKVEDRLLEKISIDSNQCWVWTARLDRFGYGRVHYNGSTGALAHRVSYEVFREPIPAGLVLDHLCRNPACINPDHLEPVTQRENLRRGRNAQAEKESCSRGHAFDPENTYITPSGSRDCRKCIARRVREYKARKQVKR